MGLDTPKVDILDGVERTKCCVRHTEIITVSRQVRLKTLPTSAVVLGAGIEGIEAAALLAKYGCPEV